jgi:hypothetical protein
MGSAQQTVTAPDGSIVSGQIANATLALPSGLTVVGNTGIGTTSPDEILHLKTTADADLGLKVQNDDTQAFCKVQSGGTALYGGNAGVNFVSGGSFATAMNIDTDGHITKPLQPAFLATPSSAQSNLSVQSEVTVVFDTEVYDVNADFASNTFTAPVTGKYQLSANVTISNQDQDADFIGTTIKTSNRNYAFLFDPEGLDKDISYHTQSITVVADMDASDTAFITFYQSAGSAVTDISSGQTSFSGCLLA